MSTNFKQELREEMEFAQKWGLASCSLGTVKFEARNAARSGRRSVEIERAWSAPVEDVVRIIQEELVLEVKVLEQEHSHHAKIKIWGW